MLQSLFWDIACTGSTCSTVTGKSLAHEIKRRGCISEILFQQDHLRYPVSTCGPVGKAYFVSQWLKLLWQHACLWHLVRKAIAITNSDLNRPCFAWRPYGKSGLFKTELVIVNSSQNKMDDFYFTQWPILLIHTNKKGHVVTCFFRNMFRYSLPHLTKCYSTTQIHSNYYPSVSMFSK